MGCLAEILAVIALFYLWSRSSPKLWWLILGVLIAQSIIARVVKESLRLYGPRDKVTIFWGVVCTVLQVALIVLCIMGFFR